MCRVVVIDDDEASLRLYSAIVKRVIGEEALAFENPVEALARLDGLAPSLIVVDQRMPEMDGITFVRAVRARPSLATTPIMMLTGVGEESLGAEAIAAGATLFEEKPLSIREFSAHLRHYAGFSRTIHGEVIMPTDERDTILRLHRTLQAASTALAWQAVRVRDLGVLIAEAMGCTKQQIESVRLGGLVYDIGMLSVPEKVRELPAELPKRWRSLVNAHVDAGAVILGGGRRPLLRDAADIAKYHHERFDGKGYPEGLKGNQIPIGARIIAVADTFMALTAERPHRVEYNVRNAIDKIVAMRGTAFDPFVVAAFESISDNLEGFPRTA